MKLVVLGMGDKEIAIRLCISNRTVSSHLTKIYLKNNVKNRAEASAMYLKTVVFPRAGYVINF